MSVKALQISFQAGFKQGKGDVPGGFMIQAVANEADKLAGELGGVANEFLGGNALGARVVLKNYRRHLLVRSKGVPRLRYRRALRGL